MKIKRIEHVAIAIENMPAMNALFGDAFGMTLKSQEDFPSGTHIDIYKVGDGQIELVHNSSPTSLPAKWIAKKGQSLFHICLEVDDIDAAMLELRHKGIGFLDEKARPGHDGARIAFIDPATTGGLLFELAEMSPV